MTQTPPYNALLTEKLIICSTRRNYYIAPKRSYWWTDVRFRLYATALCRNWYGNAVYERGGRRYGRVNLLPVSRLRFRNVREDGFGRSVESFAWYFQEKL